MKTKIAILALVGFTLATVLSAIAISRQTRPQSTESGVKTFSVNGIVRGLDIAEKTVRVEHEEIPDYMPAMTMSLSVRTSALLKDIGAGDSIRFELTVTDDDSWISAIEKRASVPTTTFAAKAAASAPVREAEQVQTGELVPNFRFTDQNGQTRQLSDFKGKGILLTFIYTRCPLPNFCPLMSKNFASLQERLNKQFPGQIELISVSIDPEFDKPEVLKRYAGAYTEDQSNWTFATGTREQTDYIANLMGLIHQPENGLISHDLRTAFIGADGKLVHLWKSNAWTPYEVQRRVSEALGKPMP